MFLLCLISLTKSIDYTGIQGEMMSIKCEDNYIFEECIFRYHGNYDSSSALFIHDGTNSQRVSLYRTTFSNCQANQGGAFSFTGKYQLYLRSVCIYNASTDDKAGLFYVQMEYQPQFSYISCSDSTSLCQTELFLNEGPNIEHMNVSACSATYSRTTTYWSYGVLYVQCDSIVNLRYSNFESCYSPDGIVYNYRTSKNFLVQYCTFRKNKVDDYSMIYCEDCSGEMTIMNSYFINNNLNSKGYFAGDNSIINLASSVYVDSTAKSWSVTTKGMIYVESIDLPNYQYFQSDECHAINPLPEMTRTFEPTLIETAMQTPHVTPVSTVMMTPFNTADITPIQTPFFIEKNTAFETPYTTPYLSPELTAIETPIKTPNVTPFDTELETPSFTPSNTEAQTPIITAFETPFITEKETNAFTPVDTVVNTPEVTMNETPFMSPYSTAHETVVNTPEITVFQTPFISPEITAYRTVINTPDVTMIETPFVSPFITAYETAENTPEFTAVETPFETHQNTSFETAKETPFVTPAITVIETPFETAESTPNETPYISPDVTVFATPEVTAKETSTIDSSLSDITTEPSKETFSSLSSESSSPGITGNTNAEGGKAAKSTKGKSNILIIIIVSIVIALIIISLIVVYVIYRKRKENSESEDPSSQEMNETVISNQISANETFVSYDNPLFTTEIEDESDPFRRDFEENDVSYFNFNN